MRTILNQNPPVFPNSDNQNYQKGMRHRQNASIKLIDVYPSKFPFRMIKTKYLNRQSCKIGINADPAE